MRIGAWAFVALCVVILFIVERFGREEGSVVLEVGIIILVFVSFAAAVAVSIISYRSQRRSRANELREDVKDDHRGNDQI